MISQGKLIEGMLNDYIDLENSIKNLELDIEELENDYVGISSISMGEKSSHTYKINRPTENEVLRKEEKITRLRELKRSNEIRKERIDNALNVLSDNERDVIYFKYLKYRNKSWCFVAKQMDLSEAWVRRLRDKAIDKMIPIVYPSKNELSIRKVAE